MKRAWLGWSVVLCASCWAWACEDEGGAGQGAGEANNAQQNNAQPNNAANNAGEPDVGEPDADEDAATNNANNNDGDDAGENNGAECPTPGRRCTEAGEREVCRPDGTWALEPCEAGERCEGEGECELDPSQCEAGDRVCLEADLVGECDPGVGFRAAERCDPETEACAGGRCQSRRCAEAELRSSYLGCEYWATGLPNIAYAPTGGTPDSPVGVVLANPSSIEPVGFKVLAPDGQLAQLVSEVTIEKSPLVFVDYEPVTVRTEIRDAEGRLTSAAFDRTLREVIPPGGMAVLLLPNPGALTRTEVSAKTFFIQTEQPVAAYQFGPYCCNYSFTNDASLLLPVSALGKEYMYVGAPSWYTPPSEVDPGNPNQPQPGSVGYAATLSVIGTKDETEVEIELRPGVEVQSDRAGRVVRQGQEVRATLQRGEILNLFSGYPQLNGRSELVGVDLTGTKIRANEPVAVFSGHECTFYPYNQGACDHLEEQLFPTETWGQEFTLVPPILRAPNLNLATEAIYWKVVALEPETRITFSAPFADLDPREPGSLEVPFCGDRLVDERTVVMDAGQTCEFGTRLPVEAVGDKPIQVMGIISGQDSTGVFNAFGAHAGDPSIYLVAPRNQHRREYVFLIPTTYFNDYLTVVAPSHANIALDGVPLDLSDAQTVPGNNDVYKHFAVSDGPHTVEGDTQFGILVFAFDDYVSYAFTGGLDLIKQR